MHIGHFNTASHDSEISGHFSVAAHGFRRWGKDKNRLLPTPHFAPFIPRSQVALKKKVDAKVDVTAGVASPMDRLPAVDQYMASMHDLMIKQQQLLERRDDDQKSQQNTILEQQNTLIRDMFLSFESSFKSMQETMMAMMASNNVATAGNEPAPTPDVFTRPKPVPGGLRGGAVNDPVHILQVDPETGKIRRH